MHRMLSSAGMWGKQISATVGNGVYGVEEGSLLNVLVPYQRQVLELRDLVLLAGHAEQRHLDLVVFGHGGVGDGLGQGHVGLRVGRLDQRPHERLGCLGGFGARRAGGDVDRVDDPFEAVCCAHDLVSDCLLHPTGCPGERGSVRPYPSS